MEFTKLKIYWGLTIPTWNEQFFSSLSSLCCKLPYIEHNSGTQVAYHKEKKLGGKVICHLPQCKTHHLQPPTTFCRISHEIAQWQQWDSNPGPYACMSADWKMRHRLIEKSINQHAQLARWPNGEGNGLIIIRSRVRVPLSPMNSILRVPMSGLPLGLVVSPSPDYRAWSAPLAH